MRVPLFSHKLFPQAQLGWVPFIILIIKIELQNYLCLITQAVKLNLNMARETSRDVSF